MGPSTGRFDVGGQRPGTPPIRGRAAELKVIGGLVTALMRGHRGVLVIEGPPGIGKSRLLTEVMALAERAGCAPCLVRLSSISKRCRFSRCSWRRCAPIPRSETRARWPTGQLGDLSYWVVHDLADAIFAAAAQTPLAIALEDIHWADNATLFALGRWQPRGPMSRCCGS